MLEETSDLDKINQIIDKCFEGFNVEPLDPSSKHQAAKEKINHFLLEVYVLQSAVEREVTAMFNKGLLFSLPTAVSTGKPGVQSSQSELNFLVDLANSFIL